MIPRLEARGHRVVAPDLPGHGRDSGPVVGQTADDFAARVESVLDTLDEPVVLVGHSMGGVVIQLVAEHRPERVAALVYLATGPVAHGQTAMSDELWAAGLAGVGTNAVIDEQAGTMRFTTEGSRRIFYGDCDAEDIALALLLLGPESLAMAGTTIVRTSDRYERASRHAILTLQDLALPPALQRRLHERDGITDVVTIDSSHSPFLSRPDELTERLVEIADRVAQTGTVPA
jgi:pimeloyl-ACP methyl ester carboxylesterase